MWDWKCDMYAIEFINRDDPDDEWGVLNTYGSRGEANVEIEVQKIQDEEMGWNFDYRIVEV